MLGKRGPLAQNEVKDLEEIVKELDWVNERAKCDIKNAFELLRQAVEKDVERYSQSGLQGHSQIEFSSEQNWMFSVGRRSNTRKVVVFRPENDHIEITFQTDAEQTLKVVPVLTETGHCKFHIDGPDSEYLFQWQLRRRVLEPILFGKHWG